MSKFKVGDRIRRLEDYYNILFAGQIYTVSQIVSTNTIRVSELPQNYGGFMPSKFELIDLSIFNELGD